MNKSSFPTLGGFEGTTKNSLQHIAGQSFKDFN